MARVLIFAVFFWNMQAAVLFLLQPQNYAAGFELSGVPGASMIQGMGLLFAMWNVPYFIALLDPGKHHTSLTEAMIMQAIGVVGETLLRAFLPSGHALIHASVTRFIWFDAGGLLLLVLAWFITSPKINKI